MPGSVLKIVVNFAKIGQVRSPSWGKQEPMEEEPTTTTITYMYDFLKLFLKSLSDKQ